MHGNNVVANQMARLVMLSHRCRICGETGCDVRFGNRYAHWNCGLAKYGIDDWFAKMEASPIQQELGLEKLREQIRQLKEDVAARKGIWSQIKGPPKVVPIKRPSEESLPLFQRMLAAATKLIKGGQI